MQIRTLFLVCMTAFIGMATALGAWVLTGAVNEYRQAGQVAMALDIDSALFSVADLIAAERPIVGTGLLANQAADDIFMLALAEQRRQADQAIDEADRLIAGRSYPGALAQRDILRTIRDDLPKLRVKADAMLTRPKPLRDPAALARYLFTMNAMFASLDFALDLGDLEAARHDGVTMDVVQLSRMGWSVRRLTGFRTAPLIAAIDAGAPLTEAQVEQQAQAAGSLKLSWTLVTGLSRRLDTLPGIVEAVQAAYGAFIDYDRICKDVIAAGRSGARYAVSARDIGDAASKAAQALKELRETAVRLARDHVAESQRAASLSVAAATSAVLLTISVSLMVLAILKRRIVSPVLALTGVIDRLARRDYAPSPLVTNAADEIGRMGAAIDVLRMAAIAAERNEARIAHMARHDALTGLANRTLLHERIEHALSMAGRGHPCAVLCLDLDRFKAVNDMYGHPVGDLLLRAVAERLNACVRETDTVSRLGGDEFVVLLVGLQQPDDAGLLAQRIIRTLDDPMSLDGQTVTVGVSVGIAIAPTDANSAVGLLKGADMALYRAKSEEPGTYRFFESDMDARLQARMALERELREAVRTEAFVLLYQPQYNLASGTLSGFEALIRWHHPTRGMVSPAAFIPLAEETGLITAIGAWVLREATKEAMQWPPHVKLAVNLSAVQFKSATLVATVREALEDAGLAPNRLELEITESVLLKNNASTLAALHALNDMGISIAMDDFGTGYSSLSYLRSFPFDNIKIDQSFVRDMSQHEGSRAIVRAIVALGDSLGMTTTAEGVETADQLAQLRLVGCTEVQGYLFSKPAPADAARLMVGGRIDADSMTA